MQYETLCNIVKLVSKGMKESEMIKQKLFTLSDFDPYSLFGWLCEYPEDVITPFSMANAIKISENNAKILMNYYSRRIDQVFEYCMYSIIS